MLNSRMPVAKVTEVMDILYGEESTGGEGVDRSVSPLLCLLAGWLLENHMYAKLTRSIQNPPLRSIISKKSLYSLLLNQSSRAISKLLQK
jgi:hypothetical protein